MLKNANKNVDSKNDCILIVKGPDITSYSSSLVCSVHLLIRELNRFLVSTVELG